jgi:6-pyruvoyltetrahydropterin/6-carboxytetrahydropterin synthase
MTFTVTRQISIDAGHRIATHGSKCRHLHGHRYTIAATCAARRLQSAGGQKDMALDFGFLKEEMLGIIDADCDHGFIAALDDEELLAMFCPRQQDFGAWLAAIRRMVTAKGFYACTDCWQDQKLYIVPFQPTAECLARHWFERLSPHVRARSDGYAELVSLRVWETPNCWAEYRQDNRSSGGGGRD